MAVGRISEIFVKPFWIHYIIIEAWVPKKHITSEGVSYE